jgi:hypothetical protein
MMRSPAPPFKRKASVTEVVEGLRNSHTFNAFVGLVQDELLLAQESYENQVFAVY